jgi:hypothetical protein
MGAGIRGTDVLPVAQAAGLRVVTGNCPSVGLVGGYTQGGGHGPLSSSYGMGADQALEWEVALANGSHVVATPTKNTVLYWALSGGGGGAYGVVVSLTVRAHKDGHVGGAAISFTPAGVSNDTYWKAIEAWHAEVPALVDAGVSAGCFMSTQLFFVDPLTLPGASKDDIKNLLAPFTNTLDALQITYSLNITSEPTYLDHYALYLGPLPGGPYSVDQLVGGRFVPRSVLEENRAGLVGAFRDLAEHTDAILIAVALKSSTRDAIAPNAVTPQWRDSVMSILAQTQWEYTKPLSTNVDQLNILNDIVVPRLTDVTPGAGAYLNEGNFALKTWKQDFYGVNYDRLRAIKKAYDPDDLFYGPTVVGSDAWLVAGDGRLCRA